MRTMIVGAGGMLGRAVTDVLDTSGHDVHPFARSMLDITDPVAVRAAAYAIRPEVLINCAAFTRVDDAESEAEQAHRINGIAARDLARVCEAIGARYVFPSSDYVFDGLAARPYRPDAATGPLSAYGRSKLAGEHGAREASDHLIVRTSWLYGAGGRNFVRAIADRARSGQALRVVADQRGAPTWTNDLARAIAELLEHGAPTGTYHASNSGETTWFEFAIEITRLIGADVVIESTTTEEYGAPAPRPRYSLLDCSATTELIGPLRHWRAALAEALQSGAF